MSIQKSNEIDSIGIDNQTDRVVLSIIDEMGWDDEQNHLIFLQEKINTYLGFIESGEIYSSYPKAEGRIFEIKVFFKYPPTENAIEFLNNVDTIIKDAGFNFIWKTVEISDI